MILAAFLLLVIFLVTAWLHLAVFGTYLSTRNCVEVETGEFPGYQELQAKLSEAIGPSDKQRDAQMVKEFLDWFNANKARLGDVTDQQLEVMIRRHISPWPVWKQYKFGELIAAYRANQAPSPP